MSTLNFMTVLFRTFINLVHQNVRSIIRHEFADLLNMSPNICTRLSTFLECGWINATMGPEMWVSDWFTFQSRLEVRQCLNLCKYLSRGCGWGNNTSGENESKRVLTKLGRCCPLIFLEKIVLTVVCSHIQTTSGSIIFIFAEKENEKPLIPEHTWRR